MRLLATVSFALLLFGTTLVPAADDVKAKAPRDKKHKSKKSKAKKPKADEIKAVEVNAEGNDIDLKKTLELDSFTFLKAFGEEVQKHKQAYEANKSKRPGKASEVGVLKPELLPMTLWRDKLDRKGKLVKRHYYWITDYADKNKKQNNLRFTYHEVRHTPIDGFVQLHTPETRTLKSKRDLSYFKTIVDGESWMRAVNIHSAKWGTETNLRAFAAFLHVNDYIWPRNRVLALLVAHHPSYQKPVARFLRKADDLEDGLEMIRRYVFDSALTESVGEPSEKKKSKKADKETLGQAQWYVLLHVDSSKGEAGIQAAAKEARAAWNTWATREIEVVKFLFGNFYHFATKVEWKHLQGQNSRGKSTKWEHEVRSLRGLRTRCGLLFDTLAGSEILKKEKAEFDKEEAKRAKRAEKSKGKTPSLWLEKSENLYRIDAMLQKADTYFVAKLAQFEKDVKAASDAKAKGGGENVWLKLYRDALADIFEVLPHYTTSKMKLKKCSFALGAANPWLFRRLAHALYEASVPDDLNRQVAHQREGNAALVFATANLRSFPGSPYGRFLKARILMAIPDRDAATKLFEELRDSKDLNVTKKIKAESVQSLNQMKKFR